MTDKKIQYRLKKWDKEILESLMDQWHSTLKEGNAVELYKELRLNKKSPEEIVQKWNKGEDAKWIYRLPHAKKSFKRSDYIAIKKSRSQI